MRDSIENSGVEYDVKFSCGYCSTDELETLSYETIINRADERMYAEKFESRLEKS